MKHSVNNKSFDEIFAQRGEQVQPENMVKGEVYLAEDITWNIPSLLQFDGITIPAKRRHVQISFEIIGGDPDVYEDGFEYADAKIWFKATPDQVELLNSYRV